MRLVIIAKDRALGSLLRRGLSEYAAELAHDRDAALALCRAQQPDLLVLDETEPFEENGSSLLEALRTMAPLCPILVLAGQNDAESRIGCLERGADDCMAKPFSMRELRARCEAMLRRQGRFLARLENAAQHTHTLTMGTLQVDRARRQVEVAGVALHLTNREFGLLEQLLLAGSRSVERVALRAAVWEGKPVDANVLEVHMAALRRKLASRAGAPRIETLRGAGYRLVNCLAQTADIPVWMLDGAVKGGSLARAAS